jgi:hypothetical protein
MKKYSSYFKTTLNLALTVVGLALFGHQASAQTILAKWTFETLTFTAPSPYTNYSTGRECTNILAELGTGTASGFHSGFGVGTFTTVSGNGSSKALTSAGWTNNPGDYYQFTVGTLGYQNISVSFDQISSGTGPGRFYLAYSTDGVTFTQFGSIYNVITVTWSTTTPVTTNSYSFDLSSVAAITNQPVVYFRLVDANNTSANGGTVGTGGTDRVDNFAVTGTLPGAPSIITQPQNTTNYFGDTVTLNVSAGGSAPLDIQWYYPNLGTPLADGSSGYGGGTISGSTSQTLTLSSVNTNQAGNYQVIVSNSLGTVTSVVAHVTVNIRPTIVTNIAYLHTLHDANFVLTDTTNLYTVEGNVTTIGDLVSTTSGEVDSFFVQDSTGGVDVFYRGGFPFPNFGDHVRITAPLLQFNGVLEMAPINGNPAHSVEILGSGSPPAPQYFSFATLPSPTVMEESIEGRYLVISNVFLGITNADLHLVGNEIIFMTNLTGQVFHMIVANNLLLGPPGNFLPGPFATSVTGVMSQSQTSGTVLTNGYEIILSDFSQITVGTPPLLPVLLNIQLSGTNVVLTWSDASFSLQSATIVTGPYTTITGASSGFTTNTALAEMFFRLYRP